MLNQVILVGRLVKTPDLLLTDSGKKVSYVTLAVNRGFKNQDGEYDTDFLDCTLWTGIAENTAQYCKTGDIIGVRGRLQSRIVENEDGTKYKRVDIIADKVTFLSAAKKEKSDEEINDSINLENEFIDTNEKENNKKKKNNSN